MTLPLLKIRSRRQTPKQPRRSWPAHLAYVAEQGCCVPGCRNPANVHHLRLPGTDACAGRRSSDRFAVGLCRAHHQGQNGLHHCGDEAAWWARIGVDPMAEAAMLWDASVREGRVRV
jgi:hypothetical protein